MIHLNIPPIIFGTSGLGNLFVAQSYETKLEILRELVKHSKGKLVFDTAGKYGAGLALETIGKCLEELGVEKEAVIICNKLAWVRTELKTPEPTFEPGVWRDLKHDAIQKISYEGILECYEQGNELLNGYHPELVSVHDPDEYLANAKNEEEDAKYYQDILDAYRALFDLKKKGKVKGVGVGAKDWRAIQRISKDVDFDWVMFANSLTIQSHPKELLDFVQELKRKNIFIIDSAVFHAGFLVGGDYYNYKAVDRTSNPDLFDWRDRFNMICNKFDVKPAEACVQFALRVPGVDSIALNTTNAKRVKENIDMVDITIPAEFWNEMKEAGLITADFL